MNKVLGPRVIQLTATNTSTNNESRTSQESKDEIQCICLSQDECSRTQASLTPNDTEDSKDSLCPFQLVKCCGTKILKKSDLDVKDEALELSQAAQEEKMLSGEGTGVGINIHGKIRPKIVVFTNKV